MSKWPLRYRLWRRLHLPINRLAWKFAPTKDYKDPRNNHWLWKLNNWVARHYTIWFAMKGRKLR